MIITISGTPGSGKSTIAKLLAATLGFRHFSAGDFMRQIAKERGITLEKLTQEAVKDRAIDDEIDRRTQELGAFEDDFVIDSRLGWKFIPRAVKILLTIDQNEAAKRIFAARRADEKENTTLAKTKKNIATRLASEITRYRNTYQLDYTDAKHHDLVIDTTAHTPEQVIKNIVDFLKKKGKL